MISSSDDDYENEEGSWRDHVAEGFDDVDLGIYDGGTPAMMFTSSDPDAFERDYWSKIVD